MVGDRGAERVLRLPRGRSVDAELLRWRMTTSGGPGGQHANRTASRVEVSVRIADLPLTESEFARLAQRLASRITQDGWIAAAAQDSRHQLRNKRTALERLEALLADALHQDARRIPTRQSRGAKLRARETKQQHAQKKSARKWRPSDAD